MAATRSTSRNGNDIFLYQSEDGIDTFQLFWDGSAHGFGSERIDAFEIIYATELPVTTAGVEEPAADEVDDTTGDDVADDATEAAALYYYFLPLINQQ
jgi:hypothetical protein